MLCTPKLSEGGNGRTFSADTYRYGFNGKEKDDNGEWGQTHYDYGFRIYNPSIAKFLSVDPLTKSYPMLTPYQYASNRPIAGIDLDGLEYLNKVEARIKIILGTAFIRLEAFSDIFKKRFRAQYPMYGQVDYGSDGIGFGPGEVQSVNNMNFDVNKTGSIGVGRPSNFIYADGKKTTYRKYTAPNILKTVPSTVSGERDRRYNRWS